MMIQFENGKTMGLYTTFVKTQNSFQALSDICAHDSRTSRGDFHCIGFGGEGKRDGRAGSSEDVLGRCRRKKSPFPLKGALAFSTMMLHCCQITASDGRCSKPWSSWIVFQYSVTVPRTVGAVGPRLFFLLARSSLPANS
jgi:hypothetical protein